MTILDFHILQGRDETSVCPDSGRPSKMYLGDGKSNSINVEIRQHPSCLQVNEMDNGYRVFRFSTIYIICLSW